MEQTWRWYGPEDPVSLADIKQAGATGVVTALHHVPIGEIWPLEDVQARNKLIEDAGLTWSVVESIPIHESIKTGKPKVDCERYTENYLESLRNVSSGAPNARIFCYNFMPVVDWTRTDLEFDWDDGSKALRFDMAAFAAFDLFILNRRGAEDDYSGQEILTAKEYFHSLSEEAKQKLSDTITMGLPGRTSAQHRTLESFRKALDAYKDVSAAEARSNLLEFVKRTAKVAEEEKLFLAIHPDDPPRSLLGLPRVVCTASDVREILNCYPSAHNGLTLCVGSFASHPDNDILAMATEFKHRTNFVHLRNVIKHQPKGSFVESDHLTGDVDMFSVMKILLTEQQRRRRLPEEAPARVRLPMRPDHGHQMLNDLNSGGTNPGYTAIGRLRGLAELRGLQMGILRADE